MSGPTRQCGLSRRATLELGASGLIIGSRPGTQAAPRSGDRLVYQAGSQAGSIIEADALPPGGPPVRAWAADPASRVVRDGSRNSQILLVRLDPSRLEAAEVPLAADGVVGFSAICTHAGCAVSGWKSMEQCFLCPCHGSVYDPADGARVVAGPAPRPLPALPLRISDGHLTVAGGFSSWIGGGTGRTD